MSREWSDKYQNGPRRKKRFPTPWPKARLYPRLYSWIQLLNPSNTDIIPRHSDMRTLPRLICDFAAEGTPHSLPLSPSLSSLSPPSLRARRCLFDVVLYYDVVAYGMSLFARDEYHFPCCSRGLRVKKKGRGKRKWDKGVREMFVMRGKSCCKFVGRRSAPWSCSAADRKITGRHSVCFSLFQPMICKSEAHFF